MSRRVVITGLGIVCSNGDSTEHFWENCLEGRNAVHDIPSQWRNSFEPQSSIWAKLPELDYRSRGVSRIEKLQNDPACLLAVLATIEALSNSQLEVKAHEERKHSCRIASLDPARAGIFFGTGSGGINSLLENHCNHLFGSELVTRALRNESDRTATFRFHNAQTSTRVHNHARRFNPYAASMFMPNCISSHVGIRYSITGANITSVNACAAGTTAIGQAFERISNGHLDFAIAGGAEYSFDVHGGIFRAFDTAGTLVKPGLEPTRANRPFDRQHSGFLFSEGGAAVLILEEYERAIQRDAPIVAEILGFGESFDAHSPMAPAPGGAQVKKMMRRTLESARLSPERIQYINAHGTGTPASDKTELEVLERLFPSSISINSTKSLIGHTLGASGAIEAVVTALSLKHQTTHVCANLEQPLSPLNFVQSVKPLHLQHALTYSIGFGGHNSGLIMGLV